MLADSEEVEAVAVLDGDVVDEELFDVDDEELLDKEELSLKIEALKLEALELTGTFGSTEALLHAPKKSAITKEDNAQIAFIVQLAV